jgi:hypothetical protein
MTRATSTWDYAAEPAELLEALSAASGLPSRRKLALAATAFVRRMGWLIHSNLTLKGLRLVELGAEGQVEDEEVSHFIEDVIESTGLGVFHGYLNLAHIGQQILWPTDQSPVQATDQFAAEVRRILGGGERIAQCEIIRCVFADPVRPVAFDPRWRTADAVGLARAIYEDRAFDRLPLLADALMDAGCEEEQVLGHCRGEGPHVRGCWVVDLILGKD